MVGVVTRLWAAQSRVPIFTRAPDLSQPKCSDWLWDPLSLLFNGYWGSFFGVKQPELQVNHSSPSIAEV